MRSVSLKRKLPSHMLMTQVAETLLSKGLCEDVCNLFSGIHLVNDNFSITDKTSKVMILDGNIICPWSKLWDLRNSDKAFVFFPENATKYLISCQ